MYSIIKRGIYREDGRKYLKIKKVSDAVLPASETHWLQIKNLLAYYLPLLESSYVTLISKVVSRQIAGGIGRRYP